MILWNLHRFSFNLKTVLLFEICKSAIMEKIETIEEFYKRKFDWMPDNLKNEIGHFNVFRLEPFIGDKAQPVPYKRRDYYKIMLVIGNSKVHYADKVVEVKKQALSFSNPHIPYKWEHLDNIRNGSFCIFNQHFFHQYGNRCLKRSILIININTMYYGILFLNCFILQ
jgi:hypothetical protein